MRLTDQRPDVMLGIDVGTQSAKCVVLDANGTLRGAGQESYGVLSPRPQWFEQDPVVWWAAVVDAVRAALREANVPAGHVQGIGITGQMHGLVLLNRRLEPLRPAMIWMDRRSANLCTVVTARVPHDIVVNTAANQLSPGFAGASLAWLREAEPHLLDQAHAVLQPKDYLILRMTGTLSSEPSDASATWLYDVPAREWSETLIQACGITSDLLPPLSGSATVVGRLTADAAYALGLNAETPVVAGAADQAALLLGAGVVEPGRGAITLGTGGQITVVSSRPMIDPELRLNTFCHALPDRWYTMGAILNGGIALRWWRNVLGDDTRAYADLLTEAETSPAGADGLIFIPYLEGERTPHMAPHATGAFVGLTARHTQAHMTRAILEGVAFAFRDCLNTLRVAGPVPDHFLIGGGGSQGALWRAILASVLNVSLQTIEGREHTATGAAMLAGVGTNVFTSVAEAVGHVVRYGATETPHNGDRDRYTEQYARFQALYPALRDAQ